MNQQETAKYETKKSDLEVGLGESKTEKRACINRYQRILPELVIACLAFYEICEALLKTSTRLHILRLSCLSVTNNYELCQHHANTSISSDLDGNIQKVAAPYIISYTMLLNGASTFSCLFLGSWSDKHGRKTVILLSLTGQILACICFSLSYTPGVGYIPGGAVCLLVGVFIYGMSGKSNAFLVGASSYVTDCSTVEQRTRLLSRLIGVGFFGNCVGFALISVLSLFTTFQWIILAVIIMAAILFLAILLFVRESVGRVSGVKTPKKVRRQYETQEQQNEPGKRRRQLSIEVTLESDDSADEIWDETDKKGRKNLCYAAAHIVHFLTRKREETDRGHIITLLICCFISHMVKVGEADALLLYVTRERVGWDEKLYGAYLSANYVAMATQLLLIYPLLERFFKPSDETCVFFGASVKIATLAATGLTNRTSLIFVYGLTGSFVAFVGCACRSALTKLTSDEEVGIILSLTSFLEVVASTIGSGIFTEIFIETASVSPGMVFYILSGLQSFTVISIIIFRFYVMRTQNH